MCWHKWGKWGNQEEEVWKQYSHIHGVMIGEPRQHMRVSQTRTCEKCGKIEKRFI